MPSGASHGPRWFMEGEVVDYLETAGVFNSGKCLAVWRP
jgi:hypothetical protein